MVMTHDFNYRFDAEKFKETHRKQCGNEAPPSMLQVFTTIVEWCNYAYLRGLENQPFKMPNFLPVRKYLNEEQMVICNACSDVVVVEAYVDEIGLNMKCSSCGEDIVIGFDSLCSD
jgi:hypothetical protein